MDTLIAVGGDVIVLAGTAAVGCEGTTRERHAHLSTFVIVDVGGTEASPTIAWRVDEGRRRTLEQTRLGRRVLCTDQHSWTTERIVHAFRGQWNVEELFRRAKKGGIAPWGPSFQHADGSLRLHTFATVIGLMLVSLVRIALDADVVEHPQASTIRDGVSTATLAATK